MSELSRAKKNPHRFMGVPREMIDWYPTIQEEFCNDCGDCVNFCAHDVFDLKGQKVNIKNPKNCVVFCQACQKMCPKEGAMKFQPKTEVLAQIKQIKKELRKKSKSESG